jgi:procollagen-lysine,2-oxoglutarate 5-dioxygenase
MFRISSIEEKKKNYAFSFSTECEEDKCDYLFVIDSVAHLDNPDVLMKLISLNRTIVSPMILRPEKAWSNFWGDFTDEGFYKRSPDYMDIINWKKM